MLIEQRAIENPKSNITQNPTLQSPESTSVARLNLKDNPPQTSRAEKLAAVDDLMSDWTKPEILPTKLKPKRSRQANEATIETRAERKKLEKWLRDDLHKLIEQRSYGVRYSLKGSNLEDFEAVVKRLRWRDPLIGRKIDSVNFIDRKSVRIWFWGGSNRG